MSEANIKRIKKIVYDHEIDRSIGFPKYRFKVYTDIDEINRISGHRFVSLVDENNDFNNDLSTLLQFLGASPFIENEYMKCGKALEDPLIEYFTDKFGLTDVQTFSYEDLENGTDEFYFIRDMEYKWEGVPYTGEVKTFYNKKKVDMDELLPEPDFGWWLQLRLELELLKEDGALGNIIFYYVDDATKKAILKGRDYTIKDKYFFISEDIVKEPEGTPEEMIIKHTDGKYSTFQELMQRARERRDELMTMYQDEEGIFYYAEVPTKYIFWQKFDHVKNYMDDIKHKIQFEEGEI